MSVPPQWQPPHGPGGYPPPPPYGPGGGYPPPPPPLPYPGDFQPPPPPKKTNWWLIGGIVLAVLVVLCIGAVIVVKAVIGPGNVTATDVAVGDCLAEIPEGDEVFRVQTVDCDEPHAGEVFAVLLMPEGDFPGPEAIEAYQDRCGPELATYSPASMTDDSVQLYVLYPTADTWSAGDRAVTCIATLDPPRTGSLRG